MITPIILLLFFVMFALSMCQNGMDITIENSYDEEAFHDYADDQYALLFSDSPCYEDHLLIVVLTEENHSDFYYIAWAGDHIHDSIDNLMGGNETALGQAMLSCVNMSNYKYSLDSNLAQVMDTMTAAVTQLAVDKTFSCDLIPEPTAQLINNTDLPITDSTVMASLNKFAAETGIPVALVIEDSVDVFGSETTSVEGFHLDAFVEENANTLIILAIGGALIVLLIIFSVKKNKKTDDPDDKNSRYRKFDDQY